MNDPKANAGRWPANSKATYQIRAEYSDETAQINDFVRCEKALFWLGLSQALGAGTRTLLPPLRGGG